MQEKENDLHNQQQLTTSDHLQLNTRIAARFGGVLSIILKNDIWS